MKTRSLLYAVALAGWTAAPDPTQAPAQAPADAAATLVVTSRARLRAIDTGDKAAFGAGLDPDGLFTDEDGVVRSGTALLDEIRPLPPGYVGRLELREPNLRISGDVAVLTYDIAERLDLFGQRLDTRYHTTDVYRRIGAEWTLIASQTSVIPSELPRVPATRDRLAGYAGAYRLGDGPRARVRLDGDRLAFEREGRPVQELVPTGPDRFALVGHPRTERFFRHDASGRIDAFVDRRDNNDLVWVRTGDGRP
jgi:Domain of unknown function (DUF4440)